MAEIKSLNSIYDFKIKEMNGREIDFTKFKNKVIDMCFNLKYNYQCSQGPLAQLVRATGS